MPNITKLPYIGPGGRTELIHVEETAREKAASEEGRKLADKIAKLGPDVAMLAAKYLVTETAFAVHNRPIPNDLYCRTSELFQAFSNLEQEILRLDHLKTLKKSKKR